VQMSSIGRCSTLRVGVEIARTLLIHSPGNHASDATTIASLGHDLVRQRREPSSEVEAPSRKALAKARSSVQT
jgi:hypothetical protein